jgi:hypothetical protein
MMNHATDQRPRSSNARRVLFLEFNEITWTVIDPMIARGKLPYLARLRRQGAWASPVAPERAPHLDPWVTWVTVHTGVGRDVHGATVLEQDAATITAKRTWNYAAEAGKSIGVFGSMTAYPPGPVPGFVVPGPFAPGDETFPQFLRPVQTLNRRYTRVHNKIEGGRSFLETVAEGVDLVRLGLRPSTCVRVARQLAMERIKPHLGWRRVGLQPLVNCDFFESLYRRFRPDFATWHTNHAAHYMHHYWRAYDDSKFLTPGPPGEKEKYGPAVEHGYEICDELLGRFLRLLDDDTTLMLVSSMGQQPYVRENYPKGKFVVRFRDVRKVLAIVAAEGVEDIVPTMVPQFNVTIRNAAERARVRDLLSAMRRDGGPHPQAMTVVETGDILTLTPFGLAADEREGVRYHFPGAPNAKAEGYALDELFATDMPTPKQGMHDPTGMMVLYGKGIRAGVELRDVTTLDVAPTVLTLLGVPVPAVMKGRVLEEAWQDPAGLEASRAQAPRRAVG